MFLLLWILIQIVAESMPISSSGHVTLLHEWFNISVGASHTMMIQFLLHVPAVLILLIYFFKTWWKMIFATKNIQNVLKIAQFIMITDLITIIFWYEDFANISVVREYFLPLGFTITAICLYVTRNFSGTKNLTWSWYDALVLGIVQGLSLLPGISRFAATYTAGLVLGYSRRNSFCISFLIQFPLLCAAILKSCIVIGKNYDFEMFVISSPMFFYAALATVFSYIVFSWVAVLIEKNKIWYFAPYMIIPISLSVWLCKG